MATKSQTQALSVVLITGNNRPVLERCLESLRWADEIVVVDRGSTDGALAVIRRYTEKLHYHPSSDFSVLSNYAIAQTTHDWVLYVEPYEWVEDSLREEILTLMTRTNIEEEGFLVPWKFYFDDRWLQHGGLFPISKLRLFKKQSSTATEHVHQPGIQVSGSFGQMTHAICYAPYQSLQDLFADGNETSSEAALATFESGGTAARKRDLPTLFFQPVSTFFQRYFWLGGYKDGDIGLVMAFARGYHEFLRLAKLQFSLFLKDTHAA